MEHRFKSPVALGFFAVVLGGAVVAGSLRHEAASKAPQQPVSYSVRLCAAGAKGCGEVEVRVQPAHSSQP